MSTHPISYVYVHWTDEMGQGYVQRYVVPHDGAVQAAREAIAAMGFDERPRNRVREVEVFHGVDGDSLRRRVIDVVPETRRTLTVRERR